MTPRNHRRAIVAFFCYVAALLSLPAPTPAHAEDIDIFTINPAISGIRPNVLIILDTSSNWASTDTVYKDATGITQPKFLNVRSALAQVLEGWTETDPLTGATIVHPGLDDRFNIGIMMYAETGNGNDNVDGGYIRKGVRQLTTANKAKYIDFFKNVNGNHDKSNNTTMGLAFYEAFLYFTGRTGYAGIGKLKRDYPHSMTFPAGCTGDPTTDLNVPGQNANDNCGLRYSNALWTLALDTTEPPLPANALSNSGDLIYNSPITDQCQKNYIIYIANGTNSDSNSANSEATSRLAALGGNTEQLTISPDGEQANILDEWTRFLANRPDVSDPTVLGNQKITTYMVEVNPKADQQGSANTALYKSAGKEGGGGYVGVTTAGGGTELAAELEKTFAKIAAVNSVFAASTLPVSVNVRGSFLNQVYMGVFRPDANSSPRWPGNVKQYQLEATGGVGSSTVFLADKNKQPIENPNTGFITPTAVSFWSTPSTFWDTTYYPNIKTDLVAANASDSPDGEFVEKGGAAQRLRQEFADGVNGLTPPTPARKLYTCIGCASGTTLSSSSAHEFLESNGAITDPMLSLHPPQNVTSLTRTGGTVTATVPNHGFATGNVVLIEHAAQSEYNGNVNIIVTGANTFTYSVTETPITPATSATTIQAAKGSGPISVTSLTRSGTTVTATAPGHTFTNGQTITITGAVPTTYNISAAISGVVAGTSFQYTVTETPVSPATVAGTATVGTTNKSIKSNPSVGVTRSGTTVEVETTQNHGFSNGATVVISGVTPSEYNGTFTITSVPGAKIFRYELPPASIGPSTPATGTIFADPATTRTISLLTRSGTTATATTSSVHGYSTGDSITVSGATQPEYNGTHTVTVTSTTAFTYTVTVSPATPATVAGGFPSITATGSGGVSKAQLVNWVRGANVQLDDNPMVNPTATVVRGYLHGDVLHSRPAVINYNRVGEPENRDLMVFYGANDGIIHAVKGGQDNLDGLEKWGFIPTEFYDRFIRLYLESPIIAPTSTRTYFADGPISVNAVYNVDTSVTPPIERLENGALGSNAKAQIYVGMRRGGRFYYSLDVTNPDAPKYMWKIDNTMPDFAELGQTWSEAKVVKVRIGATVAGVFTPNCPGGADSQGNCKVLIFGAGYDAAANDVEPQGTATMGRGIFIVDASTGAHIWSASPNALVTSNGTPHKQVSGMDFAIPADMAVINSDLDVQNIADRIYAVDTGGNIWRVNISDEDPQNWLVGKLAELSGSAAADKRRFLFAPDVVAFNSTTDSVLVGSGDREHPFDTAIANRFYMIKDSHDMTALPVTVITETDLVDLTTNTLQDPSASQATLDSINSDLASKSGWRINLATGEKVVTGATTLGGTTIFATNTPTSVSTPGSCTGPLGTALIYAVDFKNATATIDFNNSGTATQGERSEVRVGGGLPPTPIPFSTQIGDNFYEGAITGTQVVQPPSSPIGQRYRVFWNLSVDN